MQIGTLKQKIEADKGFTAETMKLIFKGKTTSNDDQVEKLGLKENDFLVVMNQVPVLLVSVRSRSLNPKLKRRNSQFRANLRKRRETSLSRSRKRPNNLPINPLKHK